MKPIGPSSFTDCPDLATVAISGPLLGSADLFFSPDDKYLCMHGDYSHLRIWNTHDRKWTATPDGYVRRAVWCDQLDGVLTIVDDRVRLYAFGDGRWQTRDLASDVPEIGLEEWADLAVTRNELVVCTPRWIRTYDVNSTRVLSSATLPDINRCQIRRVAVSARDGKLCITALSFSKTAVRFDVLDQSGRSQSAIELVGAGWELSDLFARAGVFAWLPTNERSAAEVFFGTSGSATVRAVEGVRGGMLEFIAGTSRVVAKVSPESLMILGPSEVHRLPCDGTWYNAWPSDDASLVAITYCTGLSDAPDLTGIFDLSLGRRIGRCRWHMCSAPHAISPHNRFLASVIPESLSATHPAGLPAGTLLVTDLRSFDGS